MLVNGSLSRGMEQCSMKSMDPTKQTNILILNVHSLEKMSSRSGMSITGKSPKESKVSKSQPPVLRQPKLCHSVLRHPEQRDHALRHENRRNIQSSKPPECGGHHHPNGVQPLSDHSSSSTGGVDPQAAGSGHSSASSPDSCTRVQQPAGQLEADRDRLACMEVTGLPSVTCKEKKHDTSRGFLSCVTSNVDSDTSISDGDNQEDSILQLESKGSRCYIPWSSPSLARRVVQNVKSSPKIVRRALRRRWGDPANNGQILTNNSTVFSLCQDMKLDSGQSPNQFSSDFRDAWTTMGENIKPWAKRRIHHNDDSDEDDSDSGSEDDESGSEDDSDSDEDSSSFEGREERRWNYLKESHTESD